MVKRKPTVPFSSSESMSTKTGKGAKEGKGTTEIIGTEQLFAICTTLEKALEKQKESTDKLLRLSANQKAASEKDRAQLQKRIAEELETQQTLQEQITQLTNSLEKHGKRVEDFFSQIKTMSATIEKLSSDNTLKDGVIRSKDEQIEHYRTKVQNAAETIRKAKADIEYRDTQMACLTASLQEEQARSRLLQEELAAAQNANNVLLKLIPADQGEHQHEHEHIDPRDISLVDWLLARGYRVLAAILMTATFVGLAVYASNTILFSPPSSTTGHLPMVMPTLAPSAPSLGADTSPRGVDKKRDVTIQSTPVPTEAPSAQPVATPEAPTISRTIAPHDPAPPALVTPLIPKSHTRVIMPQRQYVAPVRTAPPPVVPTAPRTESNNESPNLILAPRNAPPVTAPIVPQSGDNADVSKFIFEQQSKVGQ